MKPKLFKHQLETIDFIDTHDEVFNMSDPGTGKTAEHIVAFAKRRKHQGGKMLVLCPRSLMHSAWEQDIKKFAPELRVSVAYASNRKTALAQTDYDVLITNHDAAKVLVNLPDSYWRDFDTIVNDECTAMKNHTSGRSKAAGKLVKHFKRRQLLSATPTSNGVTNIWHQVKLLDDGLRLGKNFFNFRAAVCSPIPTGFRNTVTWEDKPNAEAIVSALISDITIRHKFEDCVDIPPNHQYSVDLELNAKHRATYEEMKKECALIFSKTKIVTAVNAAVLYTKLLQISSGAVYNADNSYTLLDTDRYELILDLAEARPHVIVFFNWQHQKDQLVKEAIKRNLTYGVYDGTTSDTMRRKLVDQFQAGALRILFAHPQSAGHGLTLTKGVATIWSSPTSNVEHYLQGLKRIHRIGQKEKTETIMVLTSNTIDEKVYKSLMAKNTKMSNFLNFLKESL